MARLARLHVPGGLYHVVLRGREGRELLPAPRDRRFFLALLAELPARFDLRILAYVLLDDRVQLALLAGRKPLSAPLQALIFRYAKALNDKERRDGPIFYDRFKAILVEPDVYLPALVRHLHLAPLQSHLSFRADGYPWSSARAYDMAEETPWLARNHVLGRFGEGEAGRRAFAHFTRMGEDGPLDPGLAEGLERGNLQGPGARLIFGSDDFAESQLVLARQARTAMRGARENAPGLNDLIALVCLDQGLEPASLALPSRNRRASYARALVAYLADELGAASLAEVARFFQRDLSGISRARARIARESKKDPVLQRKLDDLKKRLTSG